MSWMSQLGQAYGIICGIKTLLKYSGSFLINKQILHSISKNKVNVAPITETKNNLKGSKL
jgi:hypothetical protein